VIKNRLKASLESYTVYTRERKEDNGKTKIKRWAVYGGRESSPVGVRLAREQGLLCCVEICVNYDPKIKIRLFVLSASDSFSTMALYKSIYLLIYLLHKRRVLMSHWIVMGHGSIYCECDPWRMWPVHYCDSFDLRPIAGSVAYPLSLPHVICPPPFHWGLWFVM